MAGWMRKWPSFFREILRAESVSGALTPSPPHHSRLVGPGEILIRADHVAVGVHDVAP